MFCKKCGTQLKENAKFCASCGTSVVIEQQDAPVKPVQPQVAPDPFAQPVQPQAAADPFAQPVQSQAVADPFAQPVQPQVAADPFVQPVQPQVAPQPQQWGPMMQPTKEKKHGKAPLVIGLSIAALVVVLAVVIILLFACGGGGAASAQEAAEAYFEALNEEDFDALEEIIYPAVFCEAYDEDIYDEDEFVQKFVEESNPGDKTPTFGAVKITNKEAVGKTEIKSYNSALKNADGYIEIENAAEIEGTVAIKVDGEKNTYEFQATVVMAGGDWYIANIYVNTYYPIDED